MRLRDLLVSFDEALDWPVDDLLLSDDEPPTCSPARDWVLAEPAT